MFKHPSNSIICSSQSLRDPVSQLTNWPHLGSDHNCVYTYIYIYIYIHTYTYIYIYIYIYIHLFLSLSLSLSLSSMHISAAPQPVSALSLRAGGCQCWVAYAKPALPNTEKGTPNLPTNTIAAKIAWLKLSGESPNGMRIPPLRIKVMLESNPLKSIMLVPKLAVLRPTGVRQKYEIETCSVLRSCEQVQPQRKMAPTYPAPEPVYESPT